MIGVNSFENGVLGTFHETSTLHNAIIVHLVMAMRLALRRPVLDQLLCIQLAPMHLCTGKGPTGTLNTSGVLDDFNPRARTPAAAPGRSSSRAWPP